MTRVLDLLPPAKWAQHRVVAHGCRQEEIRLDQPAEADVRESFKFEHFGSWPRQFT